MLSGLLGGVIIYSIENYIHKNKLMSVRYIDAWFVSSSCVYNCGLTTLDFARLSHLSQVILMFLTFVSGITISTLPALIIKAKLHKKAGGSTVDNDYDQKQAQQKDEFSVQEQFLPLSVRSKLQSLPKADELRYRAYISCIILILVTCLTIYTGAFLSIGFWIKKNYKSQQLVQDGKPVHPFYASFIITMTGFNQNGLAPWSDSLMRFVNDVYMNLFVML
ncbi:unnamed protein product, partial [Didymodactylos carnosus]